MAAHWRLRTQPVALAVARVSRRLCRPASAESASSPPARPNTDASAAARTDATSRACARPTDIADIMPAPPAQAAPSALHDAARRTRADARRAHATDTHPSPQPSGTAGRRAALWTLGLVVATGSYANVRRRLEAGHLPPADALHSRRYLDGDDDTRIAAPARGARGDDPDGHRRKRPLAEGDEAELALAAHAAPEHERPEHALSEVERRRGLQRAIEQLPDGQRTAVLLRLEHELSLEEIARITGAGRETVKSARATP